MLQHTTNQLKRSCTEMLYCDGITPYTHYSATAVLVQSAFTLPFTSSTTFPILYLKWWVLWHSVLISMYLRRTCHNLIYFDALFHFDARFQSVFFCFAFSFTFRVSESDLEMSYLPSIVSLISTSFIISEGLLLPLSTSLCSETSCECDSTCVSGRGYSCARCCSQRQMSVDTTLDTGNIPIPNGCFSPLLPLLADD